MQDKQILVTGAAGFIGSHVAGQLAADNDVIAIDDGSFGILANVPNRVTFYERSTLDDELPTDVDIVFHFADLSASTVHEQDRRRGVSVAVEGFVNVVEQALEDGCSTVVYPSTGSLYVQQDRPVTETCVVHPTTALQAASLAREHYGRYFAEQYGLNMAGVRLFSVYAEAPQSETAKIAYPNTITQLVDAIAHGYPPILYGDGSEQRDFIHVDDVVRGLVGIAANQLTGIYNLGSGRAVSLNELVSMIATELQVTVEPQYITHTTPLAARNHGGIADCTKLSEELAWEPQVSLEASLKRACGVDGVIDA
ncbi:NAD(P)-dependent oxidoreductase [Haloferax sp. ATB1]|uniref:NAD-dependent epimerase/dehydratase family protein n=1 Tax=Haloferax sp. ATB1 TaxID=1508454 RepID=UPI0005B1EB1F|nr:NAD-dependent epimerase/dehydratase family protein [Haloferax sp. ATB1]